MEKRSVLNHMKQKKDGRTFSKGLSPSWCSKLLMSPGLYTAMPSRDGLSSGDLLSVNQGTVYLVLLRLEQEGTITSDWATSDNNRRARFYRLTRMGYKLLESEKRDWEETAVIIARFFEVKAEDFA
jgi:hypothetical protein